MAAERPSKICVRMYRVGFGDCFLLSFAYKAGERHVLIDFGSAGGARAGDQLLRRIAADIAERCGGKLHAVVATHRHADHINGFAPARDGDGPGDIIRALKPELVIQPWTEDPRAEPRARRASRALPPGPAFARRLDGMNRFAEALMQDLKSARASLSRARGVPVRALRELEFLGTDNLPNIGAAMNLATLARRRSGQRYVAFGDDCGLGDLLPGVTVRVLGPPTLEQSGAIATQRRTDEEEFWARATAIGESIDRSAARPLFPRAPRRRAIPPEARRLARLLGAVRAEQVLAVVRELDRAINNTSIILLFEAGDEKLLFPGDAQIESWMYALRDAKERGADISGAIRQTLSRVTAYKVGHHGSLNGTPKSLWELFSRRGGEEKERRLRTFLSTYPGKHGSVEDGTEVPRSTLLEALGRESRLHSTLDMKGRALSLDVELPLRHARGTGGVGSR